MRITEPFSPVRVETEGLSHTVRLANKSYTFGADGMIKSIIVDGVELLAEPIRLIMEEDGEASVFDDNYPENESESFIQSRSDEEAVICGAKQSERFIVDFCNRVRYDGNIFIDLKLMTRGRTVQEIFGLSKKKELLYKLDKMWLEIPLKEEVAKMYHLYPNGDIFLSDGNIITQTVTTSGGKIPVPDVNLPFKSVVWLGNDEKGLGWFCEREENWQPIDKNRAIEILHLDGKVVLRLRILDSQPVTWDCDPKNGILGFKPIDFWLGFAATPVKTFPKNPYIHKALHVDCGIKIKGNYIDFFKAENRFDRLVEMGVDTLILHEKWNKSQNWYELSEYTANQISYIVDECHKRGIKVLPYFGYELSSMSPVWNELNKKICVKNEDYVTPGGWWRVPFQRDYRVCYNSEYADLFIDGIAKLMDTYNIDGVYLDGTACLHYCTNLEHGCGWYDKDGNLHGTYPVRAVQNLFERLYKVVKPRGGHINLHSSGLMNFTAFPYVDQTWIGEFMQKDFCAGVTDDVNTDYFRAECSGRNFGVPSEFIAYENRPVWNFEQALSCSLIHGILPRPNDIEYPLTLMSGVWKILDKFPISMSEWLPYWQNGVKATHDKIKVSYFKHITLDGRTELLAFASNISANKLQGVTLSFNEDVTVTVNAETMQKTPLTLDFGPYEYKILYLN